MIFVVSGRRSWGRNRAVRSPVTEARSKEAKLCSWPRNSVENFFDPAESFGPYRTSKTVDFQ